MSLTRAAVDPPWRLLHLPWHLKADNPEITQKVASELTSLYLNENLKTRTEKATETVDFLSAEADKLSEHIAELETQLAAFKKKNAERLPDLLGFNIPVNRAH